MPLSTISAAALVVCAALLKISWRASAPMTMDAVHFVLGVDDFSVARMQPHFPWYPLYILAGRALSPFLGAAGALSWLSAVSGALVPVVFYLWRSRETRAGGAWTGALFLAFSPVLGLCSGEIGSDAPGLLAGMCGFLLLSRGRLFGAGILLGALTGVRASYLFFLLPAIVAANGKEGTPSGVFRLVSGMAAGVAAACGSLLLLSDGSDVAAPALSFLRGHLLEWGTPFARAESAAAVLGRILARTGEAFRFAPPYHPMGWIYLAVCLASLPALVLGKEGPRGGFWRAYLLAFFAWTLFLQNPAHIRHFLPLEVAAAAAVGYLRERMPGGMPRRVLAAALGAAAALFVLLLGDRAARPTPEYRIASMLQGYYSRGEGLYYLGGNSARVVRYYLPEAVSGTVRSDSEAEVFVRGTWGLHGDVWISDEIPPEESGVPCRKDWEGTGWSGLSEARFSLRRYPPGIPGVERSQ